MKTFSPTPPSELRPAKTPVSAMTDLFANAWVIAFLVGCASSAGFCVLGVVFPTIHDQVWTPVLFGWLLRMPIRWVITGMLGLALIWRSDVPSRAGHVWAALAGWWLTTLVIYGVWYYYPFLVAGWAAFLAWRAGWKLWSYESGRAAMLAVPLLVILGAGFSLKSLPWDNRFTFGLPGGWNTGVTAIWLLGIAAATAAAVFGLRKLGVVIRPARPQLLKLMELEPRLLRFFDATLALTPNQIEGRCWQKNRFSPAARNHAAHNGGNGSTVHHDGALARCIHWNTGLTMLGIPGIKPGARWLRTPLRQPGLRGAAVCRVLAEEIEREHGFWVTGRNQAAVPNFTRYLLLREAQIEADIYFGLEVPEEVTTDKIQGLLAKVSAAAGQPEVVLPPVPHWEWAAREYENLWFENCERLFLTKADGFCAPVFTGEDLADANAIRAWLKKPEGEVAWVANALFRLGRLNRLDLEPADPENDPHREQIIDAFNELIQKAPEAASPVAGGNLLGARPMQAARDWTSRRADMNEMHLRLKAVFGDALRESGDPVDLARLSRSWLSCRLANSDSATIHHQAASLALALFLLDADAAAAAAWLGKYLGLNRQGGNPLWTKAATEADQAQATLCAVLLALWYASLGHWNSAASVLGLGVIVFENGRTPANVLRAATHLNAALLELGVKQGRQEVNMVEIGLVLRKFEALEERDAAEASRQSATKVAPGQNTFPENPLYDRRIPGKVLAACFAARLETLMTRTTV